MKIEGPKKSEAAKAKKTGKAGASSSSDKAGFAKALSSAMGGAGEVDEVSGLVGAAGVAGILGIQAAEEATERENRKRAIEYGGDILDHLDDLRIGLVTGRYTGAQLERLSTMIKDRMDETTDPALKEILDDIDLRAQVELAKYQFKLLK